VTINGARGILFNVTGGTDLKLSEVNQAATIIKETAHPDVNLIFGAVIDESMGENLRLTVIATGFEGTAIKTAPKMVQSHPTSNASQQPLPSMLENFKGKEDSQQNKASSDTYEFPTRFNTEDLDVPAFMRKRNQN